MKVPACCLWDFAARCLILEVMPRSCVLGHVSLQVSSIGSVCFFPLEFWNPKRLFLQAFRNASSRISKLNFARRLLSTLSETSLFTQSTISLQLAYNAHFYHFARISYTNVFSVSLPRFILIWLLHLVWILAWHTPFEILFYECSWLILQEKKVPRAMSLFLLQKVTSKLAINAHL